MKKGIFIVIEGTDGGGKKTQQDILKKNLEDRGFEVEIFDFPRYGERSCAMVEDYLNGRFGGIDDVGPRATSIFYAIDRFAIKSKMIEAIDMGKVVISNRYVSSNQGYQGAKIKDNKERQDFFDWLDDLEYNIFKIPRADLYLFLDVPPTIGQVLVDQKGNRDYVGGSKRDIHEDNKEFLETSYNVYKQLSRGSEWVTINCVKDDAILSREIIAELIIKEVEKKMS